MQENEFSPKRIPIEGFDRVKRLLGPLINFAGTLAGPEYRISSESLVVQEVSTQCSVSYRHKFVFATDLHIGTPGQMDSAGIDVVFDRINHELSDPYSQNGLLFGGDFVNKPLYPVDDATSFRVFPQLLERIHQIVMQGIPVVAIAGNHDIENPDWESYYLPNLEAIGVKMLDNFEACYVGEIPIVGVPDYSQEEVRMNFEERVEQAREFLDCFLTNNLPAMYLSHNPDAADILDRLLKVTDIVPTGHSHRSGYPMDSGLFAGLVGRLALKTSPVNDHQSSRDGYRQLPSGAMLYNPAGVGNHSIHGKRRVPHELLNLVFLPNQ